MRTMYLLLACFQLAVAVLLTIVPFISATTSPLQPPRRELHFRDSVIQENDWTFPEGWSSLGCYTDDPAQPTLTSAEYTSATDMSVNLCANICDNLQKIYAGIENGQYCYCGNVLTVGSKSAPPEDCSTKCVGDASQTCGGNNRLSIYWSGATPPPQPTFVSDVDLWHYVGCFRDSNDARILTVPVVPKGGLSNNSVKSCIGACMAANYPLAGVEFANECWCDNNFKNGGLEIETKNCMLACPGDSSENCGGANSLVLYYNYDGAQPSATATASD